MIKIDKRILMFMDQGLAERDCFINPEIKIKDTGGYNFIPKNGIKGLVVFGDNYPLSGMDLTIEDHLKVYNAIIGVKPFGTVYENAQDKQHKTYLDMNGKLFCWKDGNLCPMN